MPRILAAAGLLAFTLTTARSAPAAPPTPVRTGPRVGAPAAALGPAYTVVVQAGSVARAQGLATFAVPAAARGIRYRLKTDSGARVPLQVDGAQASFIVDALTAGGQRSYRLEPSDSPRDRVSVEATRSGDGVALTVDGRQVARYRADAAAPAGVQPAFRRGGYLHPIVTPGGRVVTDDYPPDAPDQHGVWLAWTKTEFEGRHPDFWRTGDGSGTVEFVSLSRTWSGPVHGGFRAKHRLLDLSGPSPRAAAVETWEVTVRPSGTGARPCWSLDLVVTEETAGASPLVLLEDQQGGLAFRGRREWAGKDNTSLVTSEGKDRSTGQGTRARWAHVSGLVDGVRAGIAILDHPSNFRAPQPVEIHPSEPLFGFAPSQLGRWEIKPGAPYVARYRFIVQDGPPDAAEIERLWKDYAEPISVTVTEAR